MLKKRTIEYYDYFEMRDIIEKKYGIDERDYAGKFGARAVASVSHPYEYNGRFYSRGTTFGETLAWMDSKGYDPSTWTDDEGNHWDKSSQLSLEKHADKKAGFWTDAEEVPYQDFWHFMLEYWSDFAKNKPMHLNWADVKEYADEDWQKEIAQLYINEFGDQDYTVIVDW